MLISVSKIDCNNEQKALGIIKGVSSEEGSDQILFNNENTFSVGENVYEINAIFSTYNMKGNLSIKKNNEAMVNTLVSLDPTFLIMLKTSSGEWLEIVASSETEG